MSLESAVTICGVNTLSDDIVKLFLGLSILFVEIPDECLLKSATGGISEALRTKEMKHISWKIWYCQNDIALDKVRERVRSITLLDGVPSADFEYDGWAQAG